MSPQLAYWLGFLTPFAMLGVWYVASAILDEYV